MSYPIPAALAEAIVIELRELAAAEYKTAVATSAGERNARIRVGDAYNDSARRVAKRAGIDPAALAPISMTWGE